MPVAASVYSPLYPNPDELPVKSSPNGEYFFTDVSYDEGIPPGRPIKSLMIMSAEVNCPQTFSLHYSL